EAWDGGRKAGDVRGARPRRGDYSVGLAGGVAGGATFLRPRNGWTLNSTSFSARMPKCCFTARRSTVPKRSASVNVSRSCFEAPCFSAVRALCWFASSEALTTNSSYLVRLPSRCGSALLPAPKLVTAIVLLFQSTPPAPPVILKEP